MSDIRCLIVEDEPLAVKVLTDYIREVPFLKLVGACKDALLATDFLRGHEVDLIFLDIHLPKLKGMAFLKTLSNPPAIIVTTAYHQYAVEGFNLNVTDYLLKPYDFERFLVAVNKVRSRDKAVLKTNEPSDPKDYMFVTVQKKKVKIFFSEITYIESQREYVRIVTTHKEFVSKITTQEMEGLLPAGQFKRIHRSYIVSVSKVESYTADTVEVHGISLPIGRGYKDVVDHL